MTYDIASIEKIIIPIAKKYDLNAVYIFGSYARNEADDNSDVDVLIDRDGSKINSLLDMSAIYEDLENALGKSIDLVTLQSLKQKSTLKNSPEFVENIRKDMLSIYERS